MVLGALEVRHLVREQEFPQVPRTSRLHRRDDRSRSPIRKKHKRTIFIDGASSLIGSGAGILLENEEGVVIEHSLTLSFPTSNHQTEYEALLVD